MPNVAEARGILNSSDILFSAAEVDAAVDRMAEEITAELGETYPLVLSVMGGAVVFTGQLLPRLLFPLSLLQLRRLPLLSLLLPSLLPPLLPLPVPLLLQQLLLHLDLSLPSSKQQR